MKRSLARLSFFLFGLAVCSWILLTLFESGLVGLSTTAERIITFSLLVLPAGIGAVLGVMSLTKKEGKSWLAITGIIVNTLFALFHFMVVLFAG